MQPSVFQYTYTTLKAIYEISFKELNVKFLSKFSGSLPLALPLRM